MLKLISRARISNLRDLLQRPDRETGETDTDAYDALNFGTSVSLVQSLTRQYFLWLLSTRFVS